MHSHLEAGVEPVAGYVLVRLLGRGGFGEVWEAIAPGDVHVALKFIRLDTREAGSEQRALEVIRNIRHPHLLDVQFATRVGDRLVIAMPLCDQSLMDRLRACQAQGLPGVPRDELLGYMDDLARAVDFLNEHRHQAGDGSLVGVQHRDIKPHNIFLVGGSIRLADFGSAKVLEAASASHTGYMSPHYVAPEVLEGRVSQWSDQYSMALTYAQLRTGELPFAGNSIDQILYAHLSLPPDLSGIPEEERPVVARAVAKRPEDRWPTCRAFVLGLAAAARQGDGRIVVSGESTRVAGHLGGYSEGTITDGATLLPEAPVPPPTPSTVIVDRGSSEVPTAVTDPPHPPRHRRHRRGVVAGLAAGLAGLVLIRTHDPDTPRVPVTERVAKAASLAPIATRGESPPRPIVIKPESQTEPQPEPEPARDRPMPEPVPDPGPVPAAELVAETPPAVDPPRPLATATPRADPPEPDLPGQAHAILKKYCYRCHGVRFEVPGYNVLDHDQLIARRGEDEPTYVVPGNPAASYLWERVGVDRDMPSSGPEPSDQERALLARWIDAGAAFPQVDPASRPLRTEVDVLTAIRDHLRQARPQDRIYLRYFTLHNLYNNNDLDDADLRLARAAVAKLINSLSWAADIVVPQAVDREQVVLALDLRDVGWDQRDLWSEILARYPYGLKHDQDPVAEVRALAEEVYQLTGTSMPFLRADWFVAVASRPPLYHTLLNLPEDDRSLEQHLKVDVTANFLRDKLVRAGFATSGVSSQNRLVDRHPALYGAYWKSYDFRRNDGTGNLFRYPLGPVFTDNPYPHQAFEHAGGEIIFNLPNGLQGYLLVDARGHRIDSGPVEIVGDALKTAGTAAIVNGLSCMACHQLGMIPLKDTVRDRLAVAGTARDKAERLFVTSEAMDRLLRRDETRFLEALDAATGAFLKVGEDQGKTIREFAEPVGALARAYLKDLGPEEVAADLGLNDPRELSAMIKANVRLREYGLAPLLRNASIKRTEWDSLDSRFLSRFQEVARELELGTPFRSF